MSKQELVYLLVSDWCVVRWCHQTFLEQAALNLILNLILRLILISTVFRPLFIVLFCIYHDGHKNILIEHFQLFPSSLPVLLHLHQNYKTEVPYSNNDEESSVDWLTVVFCSLLMFSATAAEYWQTLPGRCLDVSVMETPTGRMMNATELFCKLLHIFIVAVITGGVTAACGPPEPVQHTVCVSGRVPTRLLNAVQGVHLPGCYDRSYGLRQPLFGFHFSKPGWMGQ